MGEIADMMLDGTLCEGCGEFLSENPPGYPSYCAGCRPDETLDEAECELGSDWVAADFSWLDAESKQLRESTAKAITYKLVSFLMKRLNGAGLLKNRQENKALKKHLRKSITKIVTDYLERNVNNEV